MATIAERISKRLTIIKENTGDVSWKDPNSGGYDRQRAEDALFHTIGPLMDNPRWSNKWTSPSEPVPGFTPGGPAPKWTENEVVFAFAGDPRLMGEPGMRDHPASPAYGKRGGAPLYRLANQVARKFRRDRDQSFIDDMYQNGFIELTKLMKPGYDEGRSPFISFVIRNIEGAMANGASGTGLEAIKAGGDVAKDSGLIGLQGLLKANTPEDARKVANQIKGKYQGSKHHDKHDDNPFGPYSSEIFKLANHYADALETNDTEMLDIVRQKVEALQAKIESDQDMVLGAGTGMGQAVTNQDRKTKIGVSSIDMPLGADGGGTMGDNIPASAGDEVEQSEVTESINFILKTALTQDLSSVVKGNPEWEQLAVGFGLKPGDKIGGPLSANEYRVIIRKIGVSASNYHGRGTPRKALNVARDANGWWTPGEDPEIEPIPAGGMWKSIWLREGSPEMIDTEMMEEFSKEYREFNKLGIAGVPSRMNAAMSGKEALSKVSIGKARATAMLKIKLIGVIYKDRHGLGVTKKHYEPQPKAGAPKKPMAGMSESVTSHLRNIGFPLLEDYDPIDRRLIVEACDFILRKLTRSIVLESTNLDEKRKRIKTAEANGIIWTA